MFRAFLAASLFVAWFPSARAAEPIKGVPVDEPATVVITPELIEAHHTLELAKLRLRQYRFVDLPQQRRQLDAHVEQTEAEIRVLQRRLRDYRPFLQVGRYSPVRTAAESHQLALLAAGQRLERLREERIALMRFTRQAYQLRQLDVLAARVRLGALSQAVVRPSNHDDGARDTAR